MMTKNHLTIICSILAVTFACAMLFVIQPLLPAQAGGGPGGGGPPLPPRLPPPSGQPAKPEARGDDDDALIGAYIELQTQSAPAEVWTVIQWQDQAGDWREVEGWQGTLEADGRKRWWVATKDFGKGPFRWLVIDRRSDQVLATSASFNLPIAAYDVVWREVLLGR